MLDFSRSGYENSFKRALERGISLFCGAGFSVLSYDHHERRLPCADTMLEELKELFPEVKNYNNLAQACTKIKKIDKSRFYEYLDDRFSVGRYDPLYRNLFKIKINRIYTTNIDDLIIQLYRENDAPYYLVDSCERGALYNEENAISYSPLHGRVGNGKEYIFGTTDIAAAFSQRNKATSWHSLAKDASTNAMLFWGWNFEDSGPLEAMFGNGNDISVNNNTDKWALLYKQNTNEQTIDYITTLGFNVIIGDTKSMLEYIDTNIDKEKRESFGKQCFLPEELSEYCIPKNDDKLVSYPLKKYFLEYTPRWSHIYSDEIPKTSNYRRIEDAISSGNDVVVVGIRGSGKTTLMMQLLANYPCDIPKHVMYSPSSEQVQRYLRLLNGHESILFVDDAFRDTYALLRLFDSFNVQIVCFDRDFNYERQYHIIERSHFSFIDVTSITKEDAQSILSIIPQEIRTKRERYGTTGFENDPTILNILAKNIRAIDFRFVNEFYKKDPDAAKVFMMIAYVHSCGTPCSFDMIYSFLGDEKYRYEDMMDIVRRIGGLIKDATGDRINIDFIDELQDYYTCRSRFFAEKIINSVKHSLVFGNVLMDFVEREIPYNICNYDKFRRSAFDADITTYAFNDILDGEKYYRLCLEMDDSEYIYQQAAIYFSRKKDYQRAFAWIEKARNLSHYNRFSIDSTYAQIYFDVNIGIDADLASEALSMLSSCCDNDKRGSIHIESFAKNSFLFFERHGDDHFDESREYLKKAVNDINICLQEDNISLAEKNKKKLLAIRDRILNHLTN